MCEALNLIPTTIRNEREGEREREIERETKQEKERMDHACHSEALGL
jgi:hypothetical protein